MDITQFDKILVEVQMTESLSIKALPSNDKFRKFVHPEPANTPAGV